MLVAKSNNRTGQGSSGPFLYSHSKWEARDNERPRRRKLSFDRWDQALGPAGR